MEITEKDIFRIFIQLDLKVLSWKDKVKLDDVIQNLQKQFRITDINPVERSTIKKSLDGFLLKKKRKYVEKRLKVDYDEMLKNASSEVVLEKTGLAMNDEKPPEVENIPEEMEIDMGTSGVSAECTVVEESMVMDLEQRSGYKPLDDLDSKQLKRRTQEIYDLVEKAAIKEKVSVDRLLGLLLKRSVSKKNRDIGEDLWNEHPKPPVPTLSDETTLAIYTDNSLGRRTYTNQKKLIDQSGYKIFPPWKHLR